RAINHYLANLGRNDLIAAQNPVINADDMNLAFADELAVLIPGVCNQLGGGLISADAIIAGILALDPFRGFFNVPAGDTRASSPDWISLSSDDPTRVLTSYLIYVAPRLHAAMIDAMTHVWPLDGTPHPDLLTLVGRAWDATVEAI